MCSAFSYHTNDNCFETSKKHFSEAIKSFGAGDYGRSFQLLCRSVSDSSSSAVFVEKHGRKRPCGMFAGRKRALRRIDEQRKALTELLDAIGQEDEKLDILCAFLTDSERHVYGTESNRYHTFLYRRMILGLLAGIGGRFVSAAAATNPEELEEALNFQFALAAYLETFLDYQRWCLAFEARHASERKETAPACEEAPVYAAGAIVARA